MRLLRCGQTHTQLRLVGVCNRRGILVFTGVLVAEGMRVLSASFHLCILSRLAPPHHRQTLPLPLQHLRRKNGVSTTTSVTVTQAPAAQHSSDEQGEGDQVPMLLYPSKGAS